MRRPGCGVARHQATSRQAHPVSRKIDCRSRVDRGQRPCCQRIRDRAKAELRSSIIHSSEGGLGRGPLAYEIQPLVGLPDISRELRRGIKKHRQLSPLYSVSAG